MVKKKFKENDIYALEVTDKKSKYFGRYIILIKSKVNNWPNMVNKNLFRFKITKDNKIPYLNEIENLEYIKVCFVNYINSVFRPLKRTDINQKYFELLKLAKKNGDEYGYYYTYLWEIIDFEKKICSNITYLGNKEINKPKVEFIPDNIFHISFLHTFPLEICEFALNSYDKFNLKNDSAFKDGMNVKISKSEFKNILLYFNVLDEVNYDIMNGKKYTNTDEDSLTYVGGEDEDPFEK